MSVHTYGKAIQAIDSTSAEIKENYRRHRLPWNAREFIGWDGEGTQPIIAAPYKMGLMEKYKHGIITHDEFVHQALNGDTSTFGTVEYEDAPIPQPYVLLANSKGMRITREEGLTTQECLELILETKRRYPLSIFVGFAFKYDAAQILADLSEKKLTDLWENNTTRYRGYRIEYRPGKWLRVGHQKTKRTATIYDVFGFFQSSFITACEKYLGKNDPDLQIIHEGKQARNAFTWDELDDFIIPYNDTELKMLVKMMNILREDFHNAGIHLTTWHGPGAIANQVLRKYGIQHHMSKKIPQEVTDAARYAYAGGRFEHFQLGFHPSFVYEYDIRSAYPTALALLPSLSEGHWEFVHSFEPETFGVWNIDYREKRPDFRDQSTFDFPGPLFCRSRDRLISFPKQVKGWYWTPEASLVPDSVLHGWVWRPAKEQRPFAFVEEMYEERRRYKSERNPTERALKLILNSLYGKLAQLVGGKDDQAPLWHQLEWAGYITSYTRARIFQAISLNPRAIISAETDAVFSTEPLDLELGEGLGQWEETIFKNILYLQSGFYYATTQDDEVICRYRGMDRDRETKQPVGLPYRKVLDHLRFGREQDDWHTPSLLSASTRFINIGLGLRTQATFRSWETATKAISIDLRRRLNKRYHLGRTCPMCNLGFTLAECLHPMLIGGGEGDSFPHRIPWIKDVEEFHEIEHAGHTPSEYTKIMGWED